MVVQCGAPVATKSLSWGSHNSNFTMVYGRYIYLVGGLEKNVYNSNFTMVYIVLITVVFMGFINQRSHHWGGPHCRGYR